MNKLDSERKQNKILYRELFFEADKTFKEQLNKLGEGFSCSKCRPDCKISDAPFMTTLTMSLPENCNLRNRQKHCANIIKTEIKSDIQQKISDIMTYGNSFNCIGCATCCKLGCSEYSYEELKQKAQAGDNFATQFTSIFIPYKNFEEAEKVFPEYVNFVGKTLDEDEKIYFYYCPNLTKENKCSVYEKRPDICRDFPDNPLSVLPTVCGFYQWKEEVSVAAMMLHAMTYIYEFYLEKVESAFDT